ncbi:hypothetical protein SS05631_c12110 [Sinorhizobium sp. CCBAU 05631]|nr:hypothetical protein SS05631_c12110 [Sinorhizobium sp. CCBAU 05631]
MAGWRGGSSAMVMGVISSLNSDPIDPYDRCDETNGNDERRQYVKRRRKSCNQSG